MKLLGKVYKVFLLVGEEWKLIDTCERVEARRHAEFLFSQGWPVVKLERVQ